MPDHDYTIDVVWAVRERLGPYGIVCAPLHAPDGISFSRNGHEQVTPARSPSSRARRLRRRRGA